MSYPALTTLVVTTVWLALRVRSLVNNLHQAQRSGLPYTLSLVTEVETWAYLTDPIIRRLYRKHLLVQQQGWPRWARFMVKDWMYEDKYRAHAEFGDMFLVVSPGSIVCYIADPELTQEVCMRRRDFIKPREKMKMIEPFGPNVVSSEGDLWRFHYRITAPPFGDAANSLVWDETRRQATLLKSAWAQTGVQSLKSDVYAVGVNVMASAGFGRQQDWQSDEAPPSGHQLSLLGAVYGIVTYLPLLLLLPKWLLRNTCKPAWVAFVEFEKYMREYIAEEQSVVREHNLSKKKGQLSGNLLTALLATNANEQTSSRGGQRVSLTEDEVIGNMFMFFVVLSSNLQNSRSTLTRVQAGYDTTANTIIFSCVALALFGNVQQELLDELDQVIEFSQSQERTELSYTEDFPQFRYMLAFMVSLH
jgi:cytochrome P450